MIELRKYLRYNADGSVVIESQDNPAQKIKAELADVSFLGFAVFAQERMDAGINVTFHLKSDLWQQPISGAGKIKYVKEVEKLGSRFLRMGIEFTEVDKRTIQGFLNCLCTKLARR